MNAIPPAALSFVFWGGKTTTLPTHQNHGSVGANTATQTLTLLNFPMYEIGLLRATYNSKISSKLVSHCHTLLTSLPRESDYTKLSLLQLFTECNVPDQPITVDVAYACALLILDTCK